MLNSDLLPRCWRDQLQDQFDLPYMQQLSRRLQQAQQQGKSIYPPPTQWFTAFEATPFEQVKVVILGQDPYPTPGQAHGLSFSVPVGMALPRSLKNIYQELSTDLGIVPPQQGYLRSWAEQGVLLLNAVLTVEQGQANAHQKWGWQSFTDRVIEVLNQQHQGLVFILWGNNAQQKGRFIDESKHLVLRSAHPSPLSARKGFFGSRPFSQSNNWLKQQGKVAIDWHSVAN